MEPEFGSGVQFERNYLLVVGGGDEEGLSPGVVGEMRQDSPRDSGREGGFPIEGSVVVKVIWFVVIPVLVI